MAPPVDLKELTIGVIPGTGQMGSRLAEHLGRAGLTVVVGSRDAEKAKLKAAELPGNVSGASNQDAAAAADVILWVVNGSLEEREKLLKSLATQLENKVIIDVTNILYLIDDVEGSWGRVSSVHLNQEWLGVPARWTTAFKATPWTLLEKLPSPDNPHDTFVVGDDEEAVNITIAVVESIPGFRAVRAGGLKNAKLVELLGPNWLIELARLNPTGPGLFRGGWRFGA